MVIVLKKRIAFSLLFVLLALSIGLTFGLTVSNKRTEADRYLVVIDAGHGGIDPGVLGVNGTKESDLNLKISFALQKILTDGGFSVVMTRTDENGAVSDASDNFKTKDFAERRRVIEESHPNFLISIHCNRYTPNPNRRGAQVFYRASSSKGTLLARKIQDELNLLNEEYVGTSYAPLKGDYFILRCSDCPSALVECGFLSNADDEQLLLLPDYQNKIAGSIYAGITEYFNT